MIIDHEQIEFEPYETVVVDRFIVKCPYCGNRVETNSASKAVCPACDQIMNLFASKKDAIKHLNRRQEERENPDKPLSEIWTD